jgi:hypothetical protein
MVRFQRLTGCLPAEVCIIRPGAATHADSRTMSLGLMPTTRCPSGNDIYKFNERKW